MPIWEQFREKKEYFLLHTNNYWNIQTSLNIFKDQLEHHCFHGDRFMKETFEICHKINLKINSLHITGGQ